MKFEVSRDVLLDPLLALQGVVERRQTLPILANVLLSVKDGGRSVAMTSAHMYHTWANPHFFQTFTNSIFWTLNLEIPKDGVDIATPTLGELLSFGDTEIYKNAQHFK